MAKNILLINPAVNPASQHRVINKVINKTIPTSLAALAGYLSETMPDPVQIIDEQINFLKESQLNKLILSLQQPRIIGMSVLTINSKRAFELAVLIKKIDAKAIIVLGGIHPTVLPEEVLNRPGIDIVVRGEGEETFKELVHLILNAHDYKGVRGISVKDNDGRIVHNSERPLIDNLDSLPRFPYHFFERDMEKYSTFGAIVTSRGCPYDCAFCSSRSISGKRYRYFSIDRILMDINLLVEKYKQKIISIIDDNMAGNQKHFKALLDAIIEKGLQNKVGFSGSMRGDAVSDELLDKAKKANFQLIAFGLETGKESLMKIINKGESVKQVTDAIIMTAKKGIPVATTIIYGLPEETQNDRWNTMRMVRNLPLSSARFNILTPYPGTPIFHMLNNQGRIKIRKDWENFAVQYMWEGSDLPYIPDGTSNYQLIFDTMFANFSFYLSISGIKKLLNSSFAGGNVIRMQKRWYFSPRIIWMYISLMAYLIYRFGHLMVLIGVDKLTKLVITINIKRK